MSGAESLAEALEGLQAALPEPDVVRVGERGPDPAERLGRRTRAESVPLEQHDVPDAGLGQVEGDAGAHDPAAEDDNRTFGGQ